MEPIRVQVQHYSGYRADEHPLTFALEGVEIEVVEILDQWLAASKEPDRSPSDYFKVLGNEGHEYLLRHARGFNDWYVVNRW